MDLRVWQSRHTELAQAFERRRGAKAILGDRKRKRHTEVTQLAYGHPVGVSRTEINTGRGQDPETSKAWSSQSGPYPFPTHSFRTSQQQPVVVPAGGSDRASRHLAQGRAKREALPQAAAPMPLPHMAG